MKIRTTIRALVCAIALSFGSAWALAADHVKVSGKTGESTYFKLSDKPTVTFTTNKLVITAGSQTVEYPLTEFRSFEFADPSTNGIGAVPSQNESQAVFSFGEDVRGEGLQPGSRVSIFNVSGQLVVSATVNADGAVSLPLNGQTGVFIVKSTSRTFKFIKK
ncbi:MAG: T9SS type A sorting domain-containing protein [Hoylesella shahii]|uniref:T9SS type A sorting domain-containing protein n=1 Tax=Hoylesella shahii TaxID=228603 RepID=UPI003FA0AB74